MRNGDVPHSVPIILRSGVMSAAMPGTGDGRIGSDTGQIGRLCEASGYLPLNSGERQFAEKRLAPQRPEY